MGKSCNVPLASADYAVLDVDDDGTPSQQPFKIAQQHFNSAAPMNNRGSRTGDGMQPYQQNTATLKLAENRSSGWEDSAGDAVGASGRSARRAGAQFGIRRAAHSSHLDTDSSSRPAGRSTDSTTTDSRTTDTERSTDSSSADSERRQPAAAGQVNRTRQGRRQGRRAHVKDQRLCVEFTLRTGASAPSSRWRTGADVLRVHVE